MAQLHLTKDDSATIGFVKACVFAGAITVKELQSWADYIIQIANSYPLYILDLSTFNEPLFHIQRVIGFVPCSGLNDTESDALVGIAFLRGRDRFEPAPTKEQALAALAKTPWILARFHETFPFIDKVEQ